METNNNNRLTFKRFLVYSLLIIALGAVAGALMGRTMMTLHGMEATVVLIISGVIVGDGVGRLGNGN